MHGLELERVNLKSTTEKKQVEQFLNSFNLDYDKDVDFTLVMRDRGEIRATCSKAKSILKCFAVSEELRGEGIASILITELINKLFEEGLYHSFIFTKPRNIDIFSSLGFKVIESVDEAALLENGIYDIDKYLSNIALKYKLENGITRSALVMNCNPFTRGHQFLIEEASKCSEEVLVFIVEEEKSLFPFKVRYDLVKRGTEHLKNVKVIPGGEYIISSATFPSYFLRQEDEKLKAYTELDASIFARYFCRAFNIKTRYVGEEPYCVVTNAYNEALGRILEKYNVNLRKISRKKYNNYDISASIVRKLIKCGKLEEVEAILPEVTWEFLNTEEGKEVMGRIISSDSPH